MRSVMLSVIISDVVLQYRYMRVPQDSLLSNRVILPIVELSQCYNMFCISQTIQVLKRLT